MIKKLSMFEKLWVCLCTIVLFSMMFTPAILLAQGKATITGRVVDASSGKYLFGANVIIKGTSWGAATNREGKFYIMNVPLGTYELLVSYIGYEEYSQEVNVTESKTVVIPDIRLKVKAIEQKEIVVEGLRQGQMKALSKQRTAATIMNIASQEQIEHFPDENTAEVLQRIPGVYIQRDMGEGRFVMVRGTSPELNNVTVNGEKLATSRSEERYVQLDVLGSSQLASVEVVKAVTPDMDGEAIGGSINLVTRSAFDYPGRRINVVLGSGYAELSGKVIGEGKINYSNRFGANNNIGLTFTANWSRKERDIDDMEFEFDEAEDINDNEIPFALDDFDLRSYRLTRTRYGIGTSLEYMLNDNHRWFIRGLYGKLNDDLTRGRWRIRVGKGDFLNPEGTLTQKSRIALYTKDSMEKISQQALSAGGMHKLGNIQFDYTFSYTYSDERHPDYLESEWDLDEKVNLALDLSNMKYPKWEITNLDNSYQYDPANYELDGFNYRETYSTNSHLSGSFNFKMPYSLGRFPSELKIGTKVQTDRKDRDEDRWDVKWKGDENITMDQFPSSQQDKDFMNGNYEYGPMPDLDKLHDFFDEHKEDGLLDFEMEWWDSEAQYYISRENIYAYYAMTTVNIGNLMFLCGFRHEITKANYKGTELHLDADGNFSSLERVTKDRNYNNFLPMFHVRYSLTKMTNIRAAITRTFSRPNYWFVTPYLYIDPKHERIRQGDPNLKPTTAMNFDIMFEHYMQGIGIASGGFFYKKLNDVIFEKETKVVGGVWDDFDLTKPVNGGDAKLYGIELTWNQELSFLPGFLNGFGIYANYTHTWVDANLVGREGFLPGQSGDVANISLSYEKSAFSARISTMYQSKYIETVGKNKDWDEWRDAHLEVDCSAIYKVLPWMQIFVEGINLTNAPHFEYYGVKDRPKHREYYSWIMKAGIKLNM